MKGDLVVCADGLQVWASLPGDGAPRLRFGDDMVIPIPEASNGLAAALTGAGHIAVVRGHNDHAFSVTRSRNIQRLGNCIGTNSVGIIPRGDVFWIANTREYKRLWQGVVSTLPVPTDASGQGISGQGWTQIWDSGEIRWTDKVGTQRIDGKLLTRVVELGLWKIGMDTSKPRILAYFATDKSWWLVANTTTQSGPQAVLVNGQPWVAISGEQCFVVKREQFTRIALATPLPSNPDTEEDADMTDAQWRELQAFMRNTRDSMGELHEKVDDLRERFEEYPRPAVPTGEDEVPSTDPADPDISTIQFLDPPDVARWIQTSQITNIVIEPVSNKEELAKVCIEHTKLGEWPARTPNGVTVEGCPWVVFDTPAGLVGCTYEWYRPGQQCKLFYVGNLHRSVRSHWPIKSGQRVGFMVSTLARDANRSLNERSDVFWTRWP